MKHVKMSDHEFSDWLASRGGDWTHLGKKILPNKTPVTEFYAEGGRMIALVIYDNVASEREIYLAE